MPCPQYVRTTPKPSRWQCLEMMSPKSLTICTWSDGCYGGHHGVVRALDEALAVGVCVADHVRLVEVAVEAVEVHADVDVHYVAVLQRTHVRNAVT